jgi:hypothetical protein
MPIAAVRQSDPFALEVTTLGARVRVTKQVLAFARAVFPVSSRSARSRSRGERSDRHRRSACMPRESGKRSAGLEEIALGSGARSRTIHRVGRWRRVAELAGRRPEVNRCFARTTAQDIVRGRPRERLLPSSSAGEQPSPTPQRNAGRNRCSVEGTGRDCCVEMHYGGGRGDVVPARSTRRPFSIAPANARPPPDWDHLDRTATSSRSSITARA